MRITIIEMSPEELNRFGTVEDLTDQVATASLSDKSDKSDKSDPSLLRCAVASKSDEIKVFGQELWAEGDASLLDLVALTMEHFGLSTAEFARIIGANRSTVSRYLNHGQCREAVLLACTNFFGGR